MTTVIKNIDLNDGITNSLNLWESCAASAYGTAIYTGNTMVSGLAAYADGSDTFNSINPDSACKLWGETLCCDQVVIYIPQLNQFAWVMQTVAGNYVLALASPNDLRDSKGKKWMTFKIAASLFGEKNEQCDFPELAVGDHFLYMTFDLIKAGLWAGRSVGVRISLDELRQGKLILGFFRAPNVQVRPVQNTGDVGYFAAQNSASELRVFAWPENSNTISHFDVPIPTIPSQDWAVSCPSMVVWLGPTSKISWRIRGATRTGTQVWIAWSGARKVPGASKPSFKFPQIGIAVIDFVSRQLVKMRYLHNDEFAFAWPSLATNAYGDVGLSFCCGGGSKSPQFGVGVLTGPEQGLVLVTSGASTGAGGHWTSVRSGFPNGGTFCGAGFNQFTNRLINHPHFVLFGVSQIPRIEVHTERNQFGAWVYVSGIGFTPNDVVHLYVDGLVGMVAPLAIGFANTAADGTFNNFTYNAHCRGGQTELATIRAVDRAATGRTATGTTYAFIC